MPPSSSAKLRFGPYELDPLALELRKLDRRIRIRPQACKILAFLISRPGEVVTREELRRHLWSDEMFVDFEHSLNFCIRQIRSALGESADAPNYIETLPRVGYRFLASSKPTVHSIAVLPFQNSGSEPDIEYLSDGITESIIRQVALIPGIQVMARSTVFRFKKKDSKPLEVGRKLGVGAVVTGTVVERHGQIDVAVELVEVATGAQLWGARYQRPSNEMVLIQGEIPTEISKKLHFSLNRVEQKRVAATWTDNAEAYRSYLRGRHFWNKRQFEPAVQQFRLALDQDPLFALAYAGLADCFGIMGFYGYLPPSDSWPKAKAAALKGLEIDAEVSEAHASLGFAKLFYDWDLIGSRESCRHALDLSPNNHIAYQYLSCCLTAVREHAGAIELMERARELDPLSAWSQTAVAFAYYFSGHFARSVEESRKALELDPGLPEAHRWLGVSLVQLGQYEEAIAELRIAATSLGETPAALGSLSRAYGRAGMTSEVEEIIQQLRGIATRKKVAAASLAVAYSSVGKQDEALDWLSRAVDNRSSWLAMLDAEPWWDPLRGDPRFEQIRLRIGLPKLAT